MLVARRSFRAVQPHLHSTCARPLSQTSFKESVKRFTDGISSLTSDVMHRVPSSDTGKEMTKRVYNRVKGSILELMVKNMSRKDREFLLRRWGQQEKVAEDMSTKVQSLSTVASPTAIDTPPQVAPREAELGPDQLTSLSPSQAIEAKHSPAPIHPIFGQLLADVGYKKVYLTSARRLVLAQVWQKQRTLRPERSADIAQVKSDSRTGFPGVITLFSDEETGGVGIVDGQHRVGALLLMMRDESWPADELNVLIEVYSFQTSSLPAVENLFIEINSAEPVKAIDMPLESDEEDVNLKLVINEVVQILSEKYAAMFKPTAKCRPPHVHADSLRDDLYSTEYLQRNNLNSTIDLLANLDQLNTRLSQQDMQYWGYSGEEKKDQKAKLNAITKAKKFKFYLGLSKRWLHE